MTQLDVMLAQFYAAASTGLILILTLIVFYWQNKKQIKMLSGQTESLRRSMESNTDQSLAQNEVSWYKLIVEYPELDSIIYSEEPEKTRDEARAYWTAMAILTHYENTCEQQLKFGLIGDDWPYWEQSIKSDLVKFSYLRSVIIRNSGFFPHLQMLLNSQPEASAED